jgi:hypothetical protein
MTACMIKFAVSGCCTTAFCMDLTGVAHRLLCCISSAISCNIDSDPAISDHRLIRTVFY